MTKFLLFIIILNFLVVIYNLYMWFTVQQENKSLKKDNKELRYYLNIEDNYRKLLLEKVYEVKEYYEDEYSKKEMGTAERVRFVGIVYGLYEAISIINQIDEYKEKD